MMGSAGLEMRNGKLKHSANSIDFATSDGEVHRSRTRSNNYPFDSDYIEKFMTSLPY